MKRAVGAAVGTRTVELVHLLTESLEQHTDCGGNRYDDALIERARRWLDSKPLSKSAAPAACSHPASTQRGHADNPSRFTCGACGETVVDFGAAPAGSAEPGCGVPGPWRWPCKLRDGHEGEHFDGVAHWRSPAAPAGSAEIAALERLRATVRAKNDRGLFDTKADGYAFLVLIDLAMAETEVAAPAGSAGDEGIVMRAHTPTIRCWCGEDHDDE